MLKMHFRGVVQQTGTYVFSKPKFSQFQKMVLLSSFKHESTLVSNFLNRGTQRLCQSTKCKLKRGLNYTPNILLLFILNSIRVIPEFLKNHSVKIVQNCVKNCEYVLAHRVRRSQQILALYSKLWDDVARRQFVNKMKQQIQNNKVFFLLSSALVSSYDWNKERITDEEILRYSAEMSLVEFLRDKRKACLKGSIRLADCNCPVCSETDSEWKSFVEENDIVVWKKEDDSNRDKGLCSYKMYARYEDVTAFDFLEAQIDLDYRCLWDTHAVKLQLIDSEPATNSDVIYWETKWPTMFRNRDYVFKRRYRIDKKRNLIFLVNSITVHPSCPVIPSKQRVSEYWSYMVIKPRTSFDEPGIEFSLTYFDNPGLNIPSTLTLWITVTGMPEYLKKLRLAALSIAQRRGDAPSPLASRETNDSTNGIPDSTVVVSPDQPYSTAILLESLRSTLFLF